MTDEIDDVRDHRRYLLSTPLEGSFGATEVGILNLGLHGVQVQHPVPLKPGARGRLIAAIPGRERKIALQGTVVWSRLSKSPDAGGKLAYRSGIHFDESSDFPSDALDALEAGGLARVDEDALQRKREALARKQQQRQQSHARASVQPAGPEVPPEHVLLIQHALNQLRSNPDEAQKWYQRARFSPPVVDGKPIPYREDVIAIWEYLQRSIDIHVVAKVFGEMK